MKLSLKNSEYFFMIEQRRELEKSKTEHLRHLFKHIIRFICDLFDHFL